MSQSSPPCEEAIDTLQRCTLDLEPCIKADFENIRKALVTLRNSLAANFSGDARSSSWRERALIALGAFTDGLCSSASTHAQALVLVACQAFANASTADAGEAVWREVWPARALALAQSATDRQCADALSYCLLSLCRADSRRVEALVSDGGFPVFERLMGICAATLDAEERHDATSLLATYVCLERDCLERVLDLEGAPEESARVHVLSVEGCALLAELQLEADTYQARSTQHHAALCNAPTSMVHLAAALRLISRHASASQSLSSASLDHGDPGCRHPDALPLRLALHCCRGVLGRDDGGLGLHGAAPLATALLDARLLPLVCSMLSALPVLQPHGQEAAEAEGRQAAGEAGPEADSMSLQRHSFPRSVEHCARAPYASYKADLLAVVANACFNRRDVQLDLLQSGGFALVLSHCRADAACPLAREWALWAVRNVCEGCPGARDLVRRLQPLRALDDEVLQRAGVAATVEGGRVRVGPRPSNA